MSRISELCKDKAVDVECGEDKESKRSEEEIFADYEKRLQSDLEKRT